MKHVIRCPCGAKAQFDSDATCFAVGEVVQKTDFRPVTTYTGKIIYLCPKCAQRAIEAARTLIDIMKTDDFYFKSLLFKKEKK